MLTDCRSAQQRCTGEGNSALDLPGMEELEQPRTYVICNCLDSDDCYVPRPSSVRCRECGVVEAVPFVSSHRKRLVVAFFCDQERGTSELQSRTWWGDGLSFFPG